MKRLVAQLLKVVWLSLYLVSQLRGDQVWVKHQTAHYHAIVPNPRSVSDLHPALIGVRLARSWSKDTKPSPCPRSRG